MKTKTTTTDLARWFKEKETFSTHEVLKWGCDFYFNSADRVKRKFAENGLIRKLSDFEKEHRGYTCKDAVYIVNHKEMANYLQPKLF